jgi:glycerol-3-phosphate dehydrogenase (NAD(P)+)
MRIGVIGAGSWGTALAHHLAQKGFEVVLWCRECEVAQSIAIKRENPLFLPEIALSERIIPTTNLQEATEEKELLLNVVPAQFVRDVWSKIGRPGIVVVSASKGIEVKTGDLMTQVFEDLYSRDWTEENLAILSGPSFAREVAQGLPTAVAMAAWQEGVAETAAVVFHTTRFRVYTQTDPVGVAVAGAVKNVIAIASGICQGLNLGENAKAALITRGLAEMSRFGIKLGANPFTFMGLAGIGDLVLTCSGDLSRNRRVGIRLGQGEPLEDILKSMNMVAEGVATTKAVVELSEKIGVEMPIASALYKILFQNSSPLEVMEDLLSRAPKREFG